MSRRLFLAVSRMCLVLVLIACQTNVGAAEKAAPPSSEPPRKMLVPEQVQALLSSHCIACHGAAKQNGKVRLDTLSELSDAAVLELLGKVQEQVHFQEMPPEESKQLTSEARNRLMDWVRGEQKRLGGTDLADKLRYPDYGNAVDHVKLFSGEVKEKAYTPSRRWLVSPQIFQERVFDLFQLNSKERDSFRARGMHGLTNPFTLPDRSGVRYYDLTALDGGNLFVLLNNAEWISGKQIGALRIKNGLAVEKVFENKSDRWYPWSNDIKNKKPVLPAFEKIIVKTTPPTDAELVEAIQLHFTNVFQRTASETEVKRYLDLTRTAITLAGNAEGLRQMLSTVLLESEFVYRLEFGAGEADAFGRKRLSPREASYAIAYALGDAKPDSMLVAAAQEGRLNTQADYAREVKRLLADTQSFRGQIDPTLNGQLQSHVTTHPKVVRFFREFFGYPAALKVFKDTQRSGGIYNNPDRGSAGTPGYLINETDQMVARIVEADRDVFKTLLTSDQFIVYHNTDNEKGAKLVAGWKKAYDVLKDTPWKTDPDQVVKDHDALIRQYLDPKGLKGKHTVTHDNSLIRFMKHFEHTFGKGNTPFTVMPWSFGNHYWYSSIYNLSNTPGQGGKYGTDEALNYQPVQPFTLANRKGILTHPSWLIAHSQNSATDPVRRGRWIREKLLAGRVPDVPITVDAQIPEDPHKTLRERLEMVTTKQECWKCHQSMNPLGLTFECYDDFGRFRTQESLEHPDNIIGKTVGKTKPENGTELYKTKPVNAKGILSDTGDPALDGEVKDAMELIDRLAKSDRVRQSIIRHAFRFYMGRNELLSDSKTLIDADQAYVASGGSFQAVIVSLLTSDSFMYRK